MTITMLEVVLADFFSRALIAGIGVAVVAGPIGCFIVWRRMAYFGDTMSHSALLGVAAGFFAGIDPLLGVAAVTAAIALILAGFGRVQSLSSDTLLGILSHSALALGMIALSLMTWVRFDLMGYLFGDLLAVGISDLYFVYGGGALALGLLAMIWRPLLAMSVHEEMALAEGVAVNRVRITFMLLIALLIAVAMKIVGVLLITSLLIIPPAAARQFAYGPLGMAVLASLIGAGAVVAGLYGSLNYDTPSGPSVVVAALLLFLCSLMAGRKQFRRV